MVIDKIVTRCDWANSTELEMEYHDKEWGVPIHDDRLLFEFLILEISQAGLNWLTILKKREGYREAFDNFDANKISKYSNDKIEELFLNPNIVRNKSKIIASIENAKKFLEIQKGYGSFDTYIWSFVGGSTIETSWEDVSEIPTRTPGSDFMSRTLKKKGFKFLGSTTCYAYMQAVGMINGHIKNCFRYSEIKNNY
ncbi:DNA-3-methyladenine glycosylase I (plasmid) [Nostoc carneum NIES-2107]|nr:DNA-3-methyladenine glycosylase I [Nostoc carneum NIES-2107]